MMVLNNTNAAPDGTSSGTTANAGKQTKNMTSVNKAEGSRKIGQSPSNDSNQRYLAIFLLLITPLVAVNRRKVIPSHGSS